VEKKLGEGSFGIVYKATHEILGGTGAIKEFLPQDLAHRIDGEGVAAFAGRTGTFEWAREKFLREARTL
jgi:serine/threonine protein kinase